MKDEDGGWEDERGGMNIQADGLMNNLDRYC